MRGPPPRRWGSRPRGSAPPTACAGGRGRRERSAVPPQPGPPAAASAAAAGCKPTTNLPSGAVTRSVGSGRRVPREPEETAAKRDDGGRGGESAPAARIARALPTRGVCSPRTAARGSWLLGARPGPPCQARGPGGRSDAGRGAGTEPRAVPTGTAPPAAPAAGAVLLG